MKQWMQKCGARSVFVLLPAMALVLTILLNIFGALLTERFGLTADLTQNKLYQLSGETVEYLQTLKQPVSIQMLAREEIFAGVSAYNAQANEILHKFAQNGKNVTLSYVDFVKDPTFASRYPSLTMKQGDVLVSSGEKYRLVKTEELFNYSTTAANQLVIASSKAEQSLLTAVLNVTSEEKVTVAVIGGHAEYEMPAFQTLLTNNNYALSNVNLLTGTLAPETKIALLIAPKTDLSAEEIDKLDAFLANDGQYGKTLLYCADAEQGRLPNMEAFLKEWGVSVDDGAVFETDENRVYNYHPFYAVADYVDEGFAAKLKASSSPFLMPLAKPLTVVFQHRDNYAVRVLLQYGKSAGVRPSDAPDSFIAADATRTGPIPALVQASIDILDSQTGAVKQSSRILISGSAGMLDTYSVENPSLTNAEYLLAALAHYSERTDIIQVRSKSITGAGLNLTQAQADTLGTIFTAGLPLAILAAGMTVWLRRRHR